MNSLRQKTKTAAIALVLLLMTSFVLMAMPVQPVEGQASLYEGLTLQGSEPLSPDQVPATAVHVKATAQLSFRPNPVGVDQTILVNLWLIPSTHRCRYLTGYKVTIVKPDETTEIRTMDSYPADTTAWFEYVVDKIGTWKLKFEFPGGYFAVANISGGFGEPPIIEAGECYYEPSSTDWQELTVQQDMVISWPPSPLPTDYWTRPVSPENREWWWIAGHSPWRGPGGGPNWPANNNKYWVIRGSFTPWVQAPNTAHVVWKKQTALSGLIGPITVEQRLEAFTPSAVVPSVIYQGRCYQPLTLPGGETSLQCYDLRTGEVYWEVSPAPIPTSVHPVWGTTYAPCQLEYTGGAMGGDASIVTIGNGKLTKINPWNGAVILDVSISPLTSGTYYRNGYALSVQNLGTPSAPDYRLINWTTSGSTSNFTARVMSNITWPWPNEPSDGLRMPVADFEAGVAAICSKLFEATACVGTEIKAASLETGESMWNVTNKDEPQWSPTLYVADQGKVAFLSFNGYWVAYNLADGTPAWKSEQMDYPWDSCGFGGYTLASAYGLLYRFAYSGVYAFNWTNGKIVWKSEAPTNPYETPYTTTNGTTVCSFTGGGWLADGKLYACNNEHSPTQPLTRGWRLFCLNATTGKEIWNITGMWSVGRVSETEFAGFSDGYMVAGNAYDGYMYVFGKGKSATTVSASPSIVVEGSSVLIQGTVFDMSPGQPGTPCVSKESMAGWMEYLHMQKPIPAEVTGVPVSLDAVDPDGNFFHIDYVTSDMSGTFSYMWTPDEPGKYAVTATFIGDDSYGSSYAETAVGVEEAPEPPTEPEPEEEPAYTAIDLAIIAAIVVVAILVLYTLWTVRKQRK